MNGYGQSEDHQPVTWVRGQPIYVSHFIVLVFSVFMVIEAIISPGPFDRLLAWFPFLSTAVLHGEVWRIVTYGVLNRPSLGFVIDMLMIIWFGRELEKFFGRNAFLRLFGCLYLLTPLLFTLIGLRYPMTLAGETGGFALFVGFATLYPNAVMLFNILAKWAAIVLVSLYALIDLSNRDWISLLSLTATTGFAFGFVRYAQGHIQLPSLPVFKKTSHLRVLPDLKTKAVPRNRTANETAMVAVDALLDKIAATGFSSLTPGERATLDAARETLRKRKEK